MPPSSFVTWMDWPWYMDTSGGFGKSVGGPRSLFGGGAGMPGCATLTRDPRPGNAVTNRPVCAKT